MESHGETHHRALDSLELSDFGDTHINGAAGYTTAAVHSPVGTLSPTSPHRGNHSTSIPGTTQIGIHHAKKGYVFLRAITALLLWYAFSILLSVYNKHMFSPSGIGFRFPIISTSLHQLTQILLALVALTVLRLPSGLGSLKSRVHVLPASIASAADIGLGNTSMLVVSLSFYTMLKSSALGFVLLFSVLFGLESASKRLVLILAIMTLGVFLMASGETEFSIVGCILVLGASMCSGLRWALVKLLLNGNNSTFKNEEPETSTPSAPRKPHPVQTILALSPGMFIVLLIMGCLIEGSREFVNAGIWTEWSLPIAIGALLLPGVLAFCMTWAEFDLLNTTGPLTLAIGGICKEVATIIVSVLIFHDHLSLINTCGLLVTIISIVMYQYYQST